MCSCRGPSTCKQGRRLYKRCSCKQWPCTYTAPCVARTCWEESQTHIAAPLWQRRSTGNRTPSTTRTPTIRPPGGNPDTRSTHPHSPDQTPSRPRWKLCSTRSPTRSGPQTARKPARLSSRTGFFFCMMEPDAARIARCIHIPPGRSATDQARREPPARPQPRTQQERARTGSRPQTPPGVATTTPTIRPPTHQQPDRYMLHPSL